VLSWTSRNFSERRTSGMAVSVELRGDFVGVVIGFDLPL
jgi:hypothetical protein